MKQQHRTLNSCSLMKRLTLQCFCYDNQLINQFIKSKRTGYTYITIYSKQRNWQDEAYVKYVVRWKSLEMRTWLWVDCRNPTPDAILLRSAVWHLIYWTKCYISQFDIVLAIRLNYASEFTPDRVPQVSDRTQLLLVDKQGKFTLLHCGPKLSILC